MHSIKHHSNIASNTDDIRFTWVLCSWMPFSAFNVVSKGVFFARPPRTENDQPGLKVDPLVIKSLTVDGLQLK